MTKKPFFVGSKNPSFGGQRREIRRRHEGEWLAAAGAAVERQTIRTLRPRPPDEAAVVVGGCDGDAIFL